LAHGLHECSLCVKGTYDSSCSHTLKGLCSCCADIIFCF
jgi:hypothetical protein